MTSVMRRPDEGRRWRVYTLVALAFFLLISIGKPGALLENTASALPASLTRRPLLFMANYGQSDAAVRMQAADGDLFFTDDGPVLATGEGALHVQFAGASPRNVVGIEPQPGVVNYLLGSNPALWHTGLPTFGAVLYRDLYPGIDLRYDGTHTQLKGTFTVSAHADPGQIRWQYAGAERVRINEQTGALRVSLRGANEMVESAPIAWQQVAGRRRPVDVRYALSPTGGVTLAIAAYDHALPLVIDPTLSYSSYYGGAANDTAYDIALDTSGNIYMVGTTQSTNFPAVSPVQSALGGGSGKDAFIVKLNPSGSTVLYATYLGGSSTEEGYGIAVDGSGNAFVTGQTYSSNFPTVAPVQAACNQGGICSSDAFVAKLNAAGSALLFSTYLGGNGDEWGGDIAVDTGGAPYITGGTSSTNFPTQTPYQATANFAFPGSSADAFVTKLAANGSALIYSTYLGGTALDNFVAPSGAIAVDGSGRAHVAGFTRSSNFPVLNAVQPSFAGGSTPNLGGDHFVTELAASGQALVFSTYLGGSGDEADDRQGIALDAQGNIYVAGSSASSDFPVTAGAWQTTLGGATSAFDAYVIKLSASGASKIFGTYVGGSGTDLGMDVAVDGQGNAHVVGRTDSANFPIVDQVSGLSCAGGQCGFVTRLNSGGTGALYSSVIGASGGNVTAFGVALDASGAALVAGDTNSANLPMTNPVQGTPGGNYDAFVLKLSVPAAPKAPALGITRSGANITLRWSHVDKDVNNAPIQVTRYDLWRDNAAPYFAPSGAPYAQVTPPPGTLGGASLSYTDAGAVASGTQRFYIARSVSAGGVSSANSNRVGVFTYALAPGQ